jgi:hypothetical protein
MRQSILRKGVRANRGYFAWRVTFGRDFFFQSGTGLRRHSSYLFKYFAMDLSYVAKFVVLSCLVLALSTVASGSYTCQWEQVVVVVLPIINSPHLRCLPLLPSPSHAYGVGEKRLFFISSFWICFPLRFCLTMAVVANLS